MRYAIVFLALLAFLAAPVFGQVVQFAWDPHEQAAEITGFKLYQSKTSGAYGTTPAATFPGGNAIMGSIPQPSLGRYYFVLTAYKDDAGLILESAYSNEVSLVLKPKPPRLQSAVQAIATAPIRAARVVAELFHHKELRIVK